jgi:sugar phosphate isomerase/epimerase
LPGNGTEVQLGRGSVDMPALLAKLEEHAFNGFVTVQRQAELGDSAKDCALAMEYLDNLFR